MLGRRWGSGALGLVLVGCGGSGASDPTASTTGPSVERSSIGPSASAQVIEPFAEGSLELSVGISGTKVWVKTKQGPVAPGCTGVDRAAKGPTIAAAPSLEATTSALARCLRSIKATAPEGADETRVGVWAEGSTPYSDLIALVDGVRKDAQGELFPEPSFKPHPDWASAKGPTCDSVPARGTKVPTAAPDEGVIVRISKTQLSLGEEERPIVVHDATSLALGFDAKHKAGGKDSLFLVPLAAALRDYRDAGTTAEPPQLLVVADERTPYRALFEVLSTAGACNFGRYQLMVRTGAK